MELVMLIHIGNVDVMNAGELIHLRTETINTGKDY